MYCVGNCYCWAFILKLRYGGEIFTHGSELGAKGREVEHYMLRDRNGTVRHFKRVFDFLPSLYVTIVSLVRLNNLVKERRKNENSNYIWVF